MRRDPVTGLPLNADGTVTVFHHTSRDRARRIRETQRLKAAAEPHVYVTTWAKPDTGYGEEAVELHVFPRRLRLDDEFPSGRQDFAISVGRPGGSTPVKAPKKMAKKTTKTKTKTKTKRRYKKGQTKRGSCRYVIWVTERMGAVQKRVGTAKTLRAAKAKGRSLASKGSVDREVHVDQTCYFTDGRYFARRAMICHRSGGNRGTRCRMTRGWPVQTNSKQIRRGLTKQKTKR